jgi:hypothetical protein
VVGINAQPPTTPHRSAKLKKLPRPRTVALPRGAMTLAETPIDDQLDSPSYNFLEIQVQMGVFRMVLPICHTAGALQNLGKGTRAVFSQAPLKVG